MSANKFAIKTATCEASDIYKEIYKLETEWLSGLLQRAGIPGLVITKALGDESFSNEAWRNFLFDTKGITISKDLGDKSVEVFQINFDTGKKVKIGQWKKPEIVRLTADGRLKCELHLKYWQIL